MDGFVTRKTRPVGPAHAAVRTALAALAAIAIGLGSGALAQTGPVPIPRLAPLTEAPAPTPQSDVADPSAAGASPLLEGANSPFAEGGEAVDDTLDAIGGPSDADTIGDLPADGSDPFVDPDAGDAAALDAFAAGSGDGVEAPVGPGAGEEAATVAGPPADIRPGSFTLEARLNADGPPLRDGVQWRIFGDAPGTDGRLPLLGETSGGVIYIRLEAGAYFVHAGYGYAGTSRRVEVSGPTGGEVFVLNAGGMRLLAINGEEDVLPAGEVGFDIYAPDDGGSDERLLLVENAPPGRVVALAAGIYHVVCRYGEANAIVRADIRVDAGKLTEATVYQKAARLTLKLVEEHGGEALADTSWSVVTPAGESVVESVGAFPTVVLTAGDYTAIAKHQGRIFEGNFSVEAGRHRDVEVLVQ
jgi:hypothetical protein